MIILNYIRDGRGGLATSPPLELDIVKFILMVMDISPFTHAFPEVCPANARLYTPGVVGSNATRQSAHARTVAEVGGICELIHRCKGYERCTSFCASLGQ